MYSEDDYLMLSGIQHFAFCRRQWAIIHIEQQWEDNYITTSGEIMHKKAHNEGSFEKRGDMLVIRGMRISSHALGLSGQCDIVEFHRNNDGIHLNGYDGGWNVFPIEYKHGTPKENNADELQLCAQAMCLEEMFQTSISNGYLYYGQNKRRYEVTFTEDLRSKVVNTVEEMHIIFKRGYTPKVKISKVCRACSIENICVPKLQKNLDVKAYIENSIKDINEG